MILIYSLRWWFSNSDVLGSAKGWAGAFKYNSNAKKIISDFFNRDDTLTLGVCNGCQLFIELGMINLMMKKNLKWSLTIQVNLNVYSHQYKLKKVVL